MKYFLGLKNEIKVKTDETSHDNNLPHIGMIIYGEFPACIGQACNP